MSKKKAAPVTDSEQSNPDKEYFDVLYTKHIHQKAKKWEDGFMECQIKNKKILLYCDNQRSKCMDTKLYKKVPNLEVGEEFKMNRYLV